MSNWISVKDRLPDANGDYLCYCPILLGVGRVIPLYGVYGFLLDAEQNEDLSFKGEKGAVWYFYDSEYGYCAKRSVTHWMPLPEPPKGE